MSGLSPKTLASNMALIKITNFGGEVPKVSARALGAENAQSSINLLAATAEFQPLVDDSDVASCTNNAKTLYRLSRSAFDTYHTTDTNGWIGSSIEKSYAKGQINDDGTERTYVTCDDGSDYPLAIDVTSQSRRLGVPAPTSCNATLVPGSSVTRSELYKWVLETLIPAVSAAARAGLYENESASRFSGGVPVAGPFTAHSLTWEGNATTWNVRNVSLSKVLTPSEAVQSGLFDTRLGTSAFLPIEVPTPAPEAGSLAIRVICLPFWGKPNSTTLAVMDTALKAIKNPKTLTNNWFTNDQVDAIKNALVARFSTNVVTNLRQLLDAKVSQFKLAVETVSDTASAAPVFPVKPTTVEYVAGVRQATWVTWDADVVTYNQEYQAWIDEKNKLSVANAATISAIVTLQGECLALGREIEQTYYSLKNGIDSWVSNYFTKEYSSLDGADKDRIYDTRFYFTTYTTDWEQESANSPLSDMLEVDQYSSVTVAQPTPPTGRNITKWNIYRSATSSDATAFQLVATESVAAATYSDTKSSEELGEVCQTTTWAEPPLRNGLDAAGNYLKGLVGMPNGVMAGFIENYVAFCHQYHPYAWPVEYQITVGYPIVGLGVFGQSLFVGTFSNPTIISGADPASMSARQLDASQACLSARSIVSALGGVLYASPDGICFADNNGVEVLTSNLFSREGWQALKPDSIVAASHDGVYYFWYAGVSPVTAGCFALDTVAKKLVHVDMTATAVFADSITDALFYVQGTKIKRAFATGRRSGTWKSGKVVLPRHAAMAWLQVDGDQSVDAPVTVNWYGDGVLRYTATVTSITPVRLPAGVYLEHEVEVISAARVTKVLLASSTEELRNG